MSAVNVARQYGYSVEPWDVFVAEEALPEGLLQRALSVREKIEADGEIITHVLYDLDDTNEGFLILGNDPELMSWELEFLDFKEFGNLVPTARQQVSVPTPTF